MNRILSFGLIVAFGAPLQAQTIHVRGKISNGSGQPVADAVVELVQQALKDTTGADGMYSLAKPGTPLRPASAALTGSMRLDKGILELTVGIPSPVKIEVFDVNGNLLKKEFMPNAQPGVYRLDIAATLRSNGLRIVNASIGPLVRTFRYFPGPNAGSGENGAIASARTAGGILAKTAAAVDTLKVSAAGYATKKIGLASYDTTVNMTLDKEGSGDVPHVTALSSLLIPASYGNPVANPGKLVTNVTYPVYYYSTSISSPLPPPDVPKQAAPKTKFCNIYTPPGYDPQIQYPLVIIMHGITDNPNTWIERANPKIQPFFDNMITAKETQPFIAVFAAGTVDDNQRGYYAFGAELMNDLLPFIESKYSVRKDRASRAMTGFSFGGMQTVNIGLCAHLKDFAWFGGLDAAGGVASASDIAKYVAAQNPQTYPLYYLYMSSGANDGLAKNGIALNPGTLSSKGPYITTANFSTQVNIQGPGSSNGQHVYPVAEVGLYNFLRMAFAPR